MAKVEIAENGCWIWTAAKLPTGYGMFSAPGRRTVGAHRWSYEHFVGPIPAGMTIDHTCHNADKACAGGVTCSHRACVNPAHLEPVTDRVNIFRGRGEAPRNAAKLVCKRGHPLEGDNLYIHPNGHRRCKECRNTHNKEQRAAYMRAYHQANADRLLARKRDAYAAKKRAPEPSAP